MPNRDTEEERYKVEDKQTGIEVELLGHDGNAFAILGRVKTAMRRGGVDPAVIDAYMTEATSGDYNHLLQVTMEYVEVS